MYPLPRRPSTGRTTHFRHFVPDANSRVPLLQHICLTHRPTAAASLLNNTWLATLNSPRKPTRKWLVQRAPLVSSRGRNHKASNGSCTSSNTRWNLDQFKSAFLPVSVRQLNLPDRSVRQAAFLPQTVRFYYAIYENPPALRQIALNAQVA